MNTDRLPNPPGPETLAESAVALRFAFPDDDQALAQLAMLDSSEPLARPILIAEVGEDVYAALSLADGAVIADPFRPTASLIELLRARAKQLQGPGRGRQRCVDRSGHRSLRGLVSLRLVYPKVRT